MSADIHFYCLANLRYITLPKESRITRQDSLIKSMSHKGHIK